MAFYGDSLRSLFAGLSRFFASLAQPQQDEPDMSYLTESEASLWADVIAGLEGEGFAYDPLTVSLPAYLATALGEVNAHKTKSVAQMLAELNTSFGGSLSHLTSSVAQLLDDLAANIGAGGGEEPYHADAVVSAPSASLTFSDPISANSAQGYLVLFVKLPSEVSDTITFLRCNGGKLLFTFDAGSLDIGFEAYSLSGNDYLTVISGVPVFPLEQWVGVIVAWDMNFAMGSRRLAVYYNDSPVDVSADIDEFGDAFDIDLDGNGVCVESDVADVKFCNCGVWIGSTIVEAGNTISEVNRRKFIGADGKPVDPTNWPASPKIKLTGPAVEFVVNQGSVVLTLSGSYADTADSPSD